jgi:ABC-type transport system substrate-binding protein
MPPWRSRVPARCSRSGAQVLLTFVLLAACTSSGRTAPADVRASRAGGTLELSMVRSDFRSQYPGDPVVNLDPARDHTRTGMELLRCCLARTLLTPDDRPGHSRVLVPDLAVAMPTVSADGLTWTFRLRPGLRYAPPLADTPIVAADFKRALTRAAILGADAAYAYEFSPIEGFDAVAQGTASSITGVDVPNERTLQIRVVSPTADLGYRLALPAAAPLPPSPRETATMGVATGHDDNYGAFLVSSGPYMYAGADRPASTGVPLIDLEDPAGITLVRNPSWDPTLDPIRRAYPEQIHISTGADQPSENASSVDQGTLDFQFEEQSTTSQATFDATQDDPAVAARSFAWPLDDTWVIAMNLAVPPFDDPYIRRAVGLAFNAQGALAAIHASNVGPTGWYSTGAPVVHIAPNDLEGGRLSSFDPFLGKKGPDRRARARNAIDKSSYQHQRDRNCTDPLCEGITVSVYGQAPFTAIAGSLRRDLKAVGIGLQETDTPYDEAFDPAAHVGIVVGPAWSTDYPNASRSFVPLSSSMITSVTDHNFSMAGASATQLGAFGYPTAEVPGVDDHLSFCLPLTLEEQVPCWTLVDKFLMTSVVPWVPYFSTTLIWTASSRVHGVVQDPFSKMVALDQVWVAGATPSAT